MRNWSIPLTPFTFPFLYRFTVRPFPDPILRKFFGHKLRGKKGPEIAKRLEASSTEFAAALNNTENKTWMERDNMRQVCTMLHDLRKSVDHYHRRLYQQGSRQKKVHEAEEPLRRPATAVKWVTIEALPLGEVPHRSLALLDRKLEDRHTVDFEPIDVNSYMSDMTTKQRHAFILRLKAGLSYPFQLWSWMKGGSAAGVSAHFLWRIPNKKQRQRITDDPVQVAERDAQIKAWEDKAAVNVTTLSEEQELHYSRAVRSAYLAAVVHPSFVRNKSAARAVWRFITGHPLPENDDVSDQASSVALVAINSGARELVTDLRMMNGREKKNAFEPFWAELRSQLNDYIAVHSRRKGMPPPFPPL